MDAIAYVHLALNLTDSDTANLTTNLAEIPDTEWIDSAGVHPKINWQNASGKTAFHLLSLHILCIGLAILATASNGLAALQQESSGDDVVALQAQLQKLGYFDGPITGYFGPLTHEAVIKFQQEQQLTPDGVVGAATQAALSAGTPAKTNPTLPTKPETAATATAPTPTAESATDNLTDNLILAYGDRNPQVEALQRRLQALGYYTGPVEGVFGPQTEAAVRQFQQSRQLTVDGVVGSATRGALNQAMVTNSATPNPANPSTTATPSGTTPAAGVNPAGQTKLETLRLGDRSPAVETLQKRLQALGLYTSTITGIFGTETKEAVLRFQQNQQLTPDGIVGTATWTALGITTPNGTVAEKLGPTLPTSPTSAATPMPSPKANPSPVAPATATPPGTPNSPSATPNPPTATPPTPSSSVAAEPITRPLSLGSDGRDVLVLQQQLQKLGYFKGSLSGLFDEATRSAVVEFQQNNQLESDGVVGSRTLSALRNPTAVAKPPESVSRATAPLPATPTNPKSAAESTPSPTPAVPGVIPTTPASPSATQSSPNRSAAQPDVSNQLRLEGDAPLPNSTTPETGSTDTPNSGNGIPMSSSTSPSSAPAASPSPTAPATTEANTGMTTTGAVATATTPPVATTVASSTRLTVREMQQHLKERGFYSGEVDGELNDRTRAAIVAAQTFYKIDDATIWSGQIPSN